MTGTLSAGQVVVQPFTATTTGTVALRLKWDDPSAKLTLFLLKRGPSGAFTRIAAATGAEMPQLIVRDVRPGRYRVRVQVPHGTTTYQLWTRYPNTPPAHPLPGYLTIMFGRSMIGAGTSSCALRPGAVSLPTIAGLLRTSRNIATLDPATQQDETCGSLQMFADNGFDRAWGMYGYPGGLAVESVQEGPVQQCFSYGRDYQPLSNPYPMAYPYLALVDDILGGRCHDPAMACYRMTVYNSRWYRRRCFWHMRTPGSAAPAAGRSCSSTGS